MPTICPTIHVQNVINITESVHSLKPRVKLTEFGIMFKLELAVVALTRASCTVELVGIRVEDVFVEVVFVKGVFTEL